MRAELSENAKIEIINALKETTPDKLIEALLAAASADEAKNKVLQQHDSWDKPFWCFALAEFHTRGQEVNADTKQVFAKYLKTTGLKKFLDLLNNPLKTDLLYPMPSPLKLSDKFLLFLADHLKIKINYDPAETIADESSEMRNPSVALIQSVVKKPAYAAEVQPLPNSEKLSPSTETQTFTRK